MDGDGLVASFVVSTLIVRVHSWSVEIAIVEQCEPYGGSAPLG